MAEATKLPVHGDARWQVVVPPPNSTSAVVPVVSVATNQVIGYLKPDSKFLSFGTDGNVTTLAFNGEIAYINAAAAHEMNPRLPKSAEFHAWGKTLEQLAADTEQRSKSAKNLSLKPKDTPVPVAQAPGVSTTGMPNGMGIGMNGMQPQPGAALATGGVQGLGQMATGGAAPNNAMK
jgi:hypothetical protein